MTSYRKFLVKSDISEIASIYLINNLNQFGAKKFTQ